MARGACNHKDEVGGGPLEFLRAGGDLPSRKGGVAIELVPAPSKNSTEHYRHLDRKRGGLQENLIVDIRIRQN